MGTIQRNSEADLAQDWAHNLMSDAINANASDIHISTKSDHALVRFRVDGALLKGRRLPLEDAQRLIRHFKVMADLDPTPLFEPAEARRTYDFEDREIDLRISCIPTTTGERMTLRLLDPRTVRRSLTELGLSEDQLKTLQHWLQSLGGLIVIAGPTGSGKTTTLYALLHHVKNFEQSVVTIEDPVEYQIDGIDQIQLNRRHNMDYKSCIRAVLRQDPDIILLGELRDAQSAHAGIEASLSGHVVMSTLHAPDAVGAISTLRHWSVPSHDLATTIQMVIAQRLVRTLCPACRTKHKPEAHEREWLKTQGLKVPQHVWRANGCAECQGLGYQGRTGVFELWALTEEEQKAIAHDADEADLQKLMRKHGTGSLLTNGMKLVESGQTSIQELAHLCSLFLPQADGPSHKRS